MSGQLYLADTNILIRLTKRDHPDYPLVRQAVDVLRGQGIQFGYTLQNMAEFWNASTRPQDRNGLGLTIEQTEGSAEQIEQALTLLPDTPQVYREWRRIVLLHRVSGIQVHDARLAAVMYAHGIAKILTLNVADFKRYEGLTAVHPGQVAR